MCLGNFWLWYSDVPSFSLTSYPFSLSTQVEVKPQVDDVKKMCIEKEKENEMQVRMDRQTASSVLERRW